MRRRRPLRIAAHPGDLDDQRTTDVVLSACDAAMHAGYESVTYAWLARSPVLSQVGAGAGRR
ncbi:MAG: hypothetical protein M3431_06015 [Actinomycetota bacterium]|nr:hypothetical protein [Actinomycetota bacterium]